MDGFAILGPKEILILRWSEVIRPGTDADRNGLPDSWEATWFAALDVDPTGDPDNDGLLNCFEFLFGTSPMAPSESPLRVSAMSAGDATAIRLVFPRRSGLKSPGFDVSSDLINWDPASNFAESVLSTGVVEGVTVDTVEVTIPVQGSDELFVRTRWEPTP